MRGESRVTRDDNTVDAEGNRGSRIANESRLDGILITRATTRRALGNFNVHEITMGTRGETRARARSCRFYSFPLRSVTNVASIKPIAIFATR